MKIACESTEKIVEIDGVKCRYWEGTTEKGVACKVFIHRIAVRNEDDAGQFEQELQEQMQPGRAVPLSAVLD